MKKLLSFAFLLLLSSCEILKPEPKEFEVYIVSKYKEYNSAIGFMNLYDRGATLFIYKDINARRDGYLFDGKETLFSSTKKLKYDKVITLADGSIMLNLKEGMYTFVCVSANKEYRGNDHVLNGEMEHLMYSYYIEKERQVVSFDF